MDPYVYQNSNVLINKLNIMDEQKLIDVEAQLIIASVVDIYSIIDDLDFTDSTSLQIIHRFLFENLYTWAGEFRTINIYKNERVLNGLSVMYCDKNYIKDTLDCIFEWVMQIDWTSKNQQLPLQFTKFMTDLWHVHPFREGNTRTISIFMKLFADKNNLDFNAELLSQNAGYLRNALVMAAVEEKPEAIYLQRIITEALSNNFKGSIKQKEMKPSKYNTVGQYKVTSYEEKSFYTKPDEC